MVGLFNRLANGGSFASLLVACKIAYDKMRNVGIATSRKLNDSDTKFYNT